MAPFTGKRKRVEAVDHGTSERPTKSNVPATKSRKAATIPDVKVDLIHSKTAAAADTATTSPDGSVTLQIITGDYERCTHGIAATIPRKVLHESKSSQQTIFTETFLFAAHTASVRCLAISPKAENHRRFLATGSADERINIYSVSTAPPRITTSKAAPSLNGSVIAENASNRSLGSLIHHDRAISRLEFPTKGKLFSSAEDNTVAISRTRDWTMLSSIKAPIPKVQGRPSGDTAAPGEVPAGINDFAIHPSQKLMLSVSRGEKCMRLWNLMTGKKAGVLNFDRSLLTQLGEGKYSSGEGRRTLWDDAGEHYVVGFERGAALFGIDSKPRAVCRATPTSKLHQYRLVPKLSDDGEDILAVSTEDGRILFFDLKTEADASEDTLPSLRCIAQLGGKSAGITTRVKDFVMLSIPATGSQKAIWSIVAAGSDGNLWLWVIEDQDLKTDQDSKQIGRLVASHKTQSRITCLAAFVMDGQATAAPLDDLETDKPETEVEDSD